VNEQKVPHLVGGLGKKTYGKQWKNQDRIYDSVSVNSIAMAITTTGRPWYMVKESEKKNDS